MYYISRATTSVAVIALAAAAWFSARLALADAAFRNRTPASVEKAIALAPLDSDYLSFRALQLEYDGQNPEPLLERIAILNPLSSSPRIRLGLAAELGGEIAAAEKWLQDAARVDHQFETRWTLANFYFRRGPSDPESVNQFWKWMRSGLDVSYGDRRPAFDLCWRMSQDPAEILSRAIPDRRDVAAAYLGYVLEQHRLDAVATAALKLAATRDPQDRPLLYAACDVLLDSATGAGSASDRSVALASARAVWQAMGKEQPTAVTNGSFATPPENHGFDWRLFESPGVTDVNLDAPPAHRVTLSGRQPESCGLLEQMVSLQTGQSYTLHWESRTQSLSAPTGIEWRIAGAHAPITPSDDWRTGEAHFTASSGVVPLMLTFERPSGKARAEGSIDIRAVAIHPSSP
jgi:hypothetical protein